MGWWLWHRSAHIVHTKRLDRASEGGTGGGAWWAAEETATCSAPSRPVLRYVVVVEVIGPYRRGTISDPGSQSASLYYMHTMYHTVLYCSIICGEREKRRDVFI